MIRQNDTAAALTASLREDNADDRTREEIVYPERPRHRGAKIGVLIGVLVLVAAGLFGGYRWSQSQYYVSVTQEKVAIYQGVPSQIGPFELSHIVEETDVTFNDLTPLARERLDSPITRSSLHEAREVVKNLRASIDNSTKADDKKTDGDSTKKPSPAPKITKLKETPQ